MASDTVSERFMKTGQYNDMREYQELKTSKEMEIAGTRKLYEHLKRKHGHTAALRMMISKGYDVGLLPR